MRGARKSRPSSKGNLGKKDEKKEDPYYSVEKILDVKVEKETGRKLYKVRWKTYDPTHDSWEPPSNFHPLCPGLLSDFDSRFERMRQERVAYLHENGQVFKEEEIEDVNILSEEIEEIRNRKIDRNNEQRTLYEVKWRGTDVLSWVAEGDLVHAKDKLDAFQHRMRVNLLQKGQESTPDHGADREKRVREREFYEAVEKGEAVSFETDLYSRVKGRRSRDILSPSQPSTSRNSQRSKRIIATDDETSDVEMQIIGYVPNASGNQDMEKSHQGGETSANSSKGKFLADLPCYNSFRSQLEFERLEQQQLVLSKEEFIAAVDRDDYQTLLASLCSGCVPELDFTSLFLSASRRGGRDVALLLATRVSDLSTRDLYGNSAICMAAELGDICFAHHLFAMGVSKRECNGASQSLQQIASKFGHRHFIRFLKKYKR